MSTGVGNSILRKLRANTEATNPARGFDMDKEAFDIVLCVERFWGDLSVKVLEKAVEVAKERAKR